MSLLFEEAIADAKKLRELAEENAKKAIIEKMAPKIRKLIETELLKEHGVVDTKDDSDEDDILLDLIDGGEKNNKYEEPTVALGGTEEKASLTLPDEDGKITLDLDSLASTPSILPAVSQEVELTAESIKTLSSVLGLKNDKENINSIELQVYRLGDELKETLKIEGEISESNENNEKINGILSKIENTYFNVRESKTINSELKLKLEEKLEGFYKELKMEKKDNKTMKLEADMAYEADDVDVMAGGDEELVLKIKGLPSDLDLDALDVDLEVAGKEGDKDADDAAGLDDLEVGGDEDMELSDDDVVEVSESLLRNEIANMKNKKSINEEGPGGAPGPKEADDFGGGKIEGDALLDAEESNKNEAKEFALKEEQYKNLVKDLEVKLQEANLFNAKLVYTNKLLQTNAGLSKPQKLKIVESFDSAKSIREVKLLYKTLTESLGTPSEKQLDESVEQRRVLGSSSKAVKGSGTSSVKQTLTEGADEFNRWSELAGLK